MGSSLALCAAAGAAFALCLPKPGLCALAWGAPAVLFYFLPRARGVRAAACLAGVFGFFFCGVSLHWIFLTTRFAGVPLPVGLLAWCALAGLLALNWAVFGAAARVLSGPWAWAAAWAAVESASAWWTPRVGVDLLSYTQWRYLPFIQIGAVLGPHALGFVIMLWNAALAEAFCERRFRNLAAAGGLAAGCFAYGTAVLGGREDPSGGPVVEIYQPNIDQYRKWDERYEDFIRDSFEELLREPRGETPALLLWPESSLPGWLDEPDIARWVSGCAKRAGAPILTGAVTRSGIRHHNSGVLLGADGEVAGVYHKRQLVPFGEFVPLRGLFQGWIGILAQMGDFDSGADRQELLATPVGRTAVSICYEAVFPRWARIDSSRGARVFVNLTNDGWYKDTWGPQQHFYTNMYRAVENRVLVLRAANTGISGAIDAYGVVLAKTEVETRRRLSASLPARDPFPRGSPYSRQGDWFGACAMLAAAASLAWACRDKVAKIF
ncbi:MAG: apolipoprotein N-acyltransferase [Elusimicrobiota bacterium]